MVMIKYVEANGTEHDVDATPGVSLMQNAVRNRVPGIAERWLAVPVAIAAAAATLLFTQATDESLLYSRTKGAPTLGFYIKRNGQVIRGANEEVVFPGDVLRFTYTVERPVYFAVLNAEAHSAAIYHPLTPKLVLIEPGRDAALDFGIELDEQLGMERVYAVFCNAPLEIEPLRRALEAEGHLPSLPDCNIDILTLDKRSR